MSRLITVVALCLVALSAGAGTLDRIRDTSVMRIGYRVGAPPFSDRVGQGEPRGFSIDLCRRIAAAAKEQLGLDALDVRYVEVSAENRFAAVADGRIDIECASTTNTLAREELVGFTRTIYVTGGSLVSRADAPVHLADDMEGRTVAVTRGTTTEAALAEHLEAMQIHAKVRPVGSHDDGMALLTSGKVDVFAADRVVLFGLVRDVKKPADYVMSDDLFSYEPYALAVHRDDADFRLLADRTLARLYRSGEIGDIYERWFGPLGLAPTELLVTLYSLEALPE